MLAKSIGVLPLDGAVIVAMKPPFGTTAPKGIMDKAEEKDKFWFA